MAPAFGNTDTAKTNPQAARSRGRLSALFRAAALGGALCAPLAASTPVPHDSSTPQAQWDGFVASETEPYDFTMDGIPVPPPAGGTGAAMPRRTIAVQVEDYDIVLDGLALLNKDAAISTRVMRHGAAAASILNQTADRLASGDVDVLFANRAEDNQSWFWEGRDARYGDLLFKTADVVSISSTPVPSINTYFNSGSIDTRAEIDRADRLWQESKTILVMATSNNGQTGTIERQSAFFPLRGDTVLRVGAAEIGPDGLPHYAAYSGLAAPSVLAVNPFSNGFSYPLFPQGDALRRILEERYTETPEGWPRSAKEIFAEQMIAREYAERTPSVKRFCHDNPRGGDYEAAEILERDAGWQRNHPEEVRAACIEGLVDTARILNQRHGADAEGNLTNVPGVSFSTPAAAGMVAAMHATHPALNEYDLTAAALIAAEPLTSGILNGKVREDVVEYTENARGLPWNHFIAGFGLLTPDAYKGTVGEIAAVLAENPTLSHEERRADSGYVEMGAPAITQAADSVPFADYKISIDEDIISLRASLALQFKGSFAAIKPQIVILIDPAGHAVALSPSSMEHSSGYSLASTEGHFGTYAKGEWTIRLMGGAELAEARLTLAGMEAGGLIDTYLERISGRTEQAPAQMPAPSPAPF